MPPTSKKRKRSKPAEPDPEPASDDGVLGLPTPQRTITKSKRPRGREHPDDKTERLKAPCSTQHLQQSSPHSQKEQSRPAEVVPDSDIEDASELCDPSVPHPTKCFLLELPVEQQLTIFELAYPQQEGVQYIDKSTWDFLQGDKLRRDATYEFEEFNCHKVNEWLLSKQYFVQAGRAWMKANMSSLYCQHVPASEWFEMGLYRPMVTSLELSYGSSLKIARYGDEKHFLLGCASLTTLVVRITRYWMDDEYDGMWQKLLTKASLSEFFDRTALQQGCQRILRGSSQRQDEGHAGSKYAAIERTLRKTALLPKDSAYIETHHNAAFLYPGSKVRWDGQTHFDDPESGRCLAASSRASTPEVIREYATASTQTDISLWSPLRPEYASTSVQSENQPSFSTEVDEATLDQLVYEAELVHNMLKKKARERGGSIVVKGFPSFDPHAQQLLECD